jgi:hypothetical protein
MRTVMSACIACVLAGTIATFAQQQPPTQPPQEQEKQAPPASTLTGCVQEAKTTDGGTVYVLNNAQGGSAAMYVLVASPSTELASHVNHKIEVTGQVQEPPPPPAAEGAAPKPNVVRPPAVQIESLKMVAESCK